MQVKKVEIHSDHGGYVVTGWDQVERLLKIYIEIDKKNLLKEDPSFREENPRQGLSNSNQEYEALLTRTLRKARLVLGGKDQFSQEVLDFLGCIRTSLTIKVLNRATNTYYLSWFNVYLSDTVQKKLKKEVGLKESLHYVRINVFIKPTHSYNFDAFVKRLSTVVPLQVTGAQIEKELISNPKQEIEYLIYKDDQIQIKLARKGFKEQVQRSFLSTIEKAELVILIYGVDKNDDVDTFYNDGDEQYVQELAEQMKRALLQLK